MGNAAHIGRVGALAVALGIGSWLASTPPVANAQPSNTSTASGATASAAKPKPAAVGKTHRVTPSLAAGPSSAKVAKPAHLSAPVMHAPTVHSIAVAVHSLVGDGRPPTPATISSMLAYAGDELRRITGIGKQGAVTTTAVPATGPNLLTNPGAELGDPAGYGNSTVSVPGWTATGTPTVVQYGELRNAWPVGLSFAWPNLPAIVSFPGVNAAPPGGGAQFFGGGDVATSKLSQTVDLSASSAEIDSGTVPFNLNGYLGGYLLDPSFASVKVTFLDQNQLYLGSSTIGPVSNLDRWGQTGFRQRTSIGTVPVGTRSAVVTLTMHDLNPVVIGFTARYNNAYADNLSFSIGTAQPAPPAPTPPVSDVQPLDHVFLVYMENKGYNDIVGSPNAPFLNSLINGYGLANNYYAVTHPSLPNYYAIVGGQVYGKTYNCKSVCITDPNNLAVNLDTHGKTWAAYAQGMTPGQPLQSTANYSTDQTPWPAFAGIGDNQAYAAAHMFPLTQMAIDLQSDATTPDFVWFAADEDSNGEGPVDSLAGVAHFAFSQIDPRHQYNVPALDQFLADNVPTIMNSDVWNTTKSVLIVTFDEDNNNITLGFGNEGNHVVTVVIPSPMAVSAGGMKGGAFVVTDHYDHYSTLRTIEDALGLPPMTNNDKYAQPLNGFWT
ncbi:alkaline phosphatase family protein [Mycolicibacterium aichiense]|uniref:alkaline phosphatase family protein n=1 Tax=Mycolicibacterium aichiense TaxID=1799 RepID=UPI000DF8DED4|nr:alkaline phosphatase family protein [Mycolicibacterium aichiense]MCV7020899.1 phosphoesterase [Mycolicibacterium aichiense]STZ25182.1 Phosphoesterase family protein [Mycolicibacterium aichiense]